MFSFLSTRNMKFCSVILIHMNIPGIEKYKEIIPSSSSLFFRLPRLKKQKKSLFLVFVLQRQSKLQSTIYRNHCPSDKLSAFSTTFGRFYYMHTRLVVMCIYIRRDKFNDITLLAIILSPDFYLHSLALKWQGINSSDNIAIIDNMINVNSTSANLDTDNNANTFQILNNT